MNTRYYVKLNSDGNPYGQVHQLDPNDQFSRWRHSDYLHIDDPRLPEEERLIGWEWAQLKKLQQHMPILEEIARDSQGCVADYLDDLDLHCIADAIRGKLYWWYPQTDRLYVRMPTTPPVTWTTHHINHPKLIVISLTGYRGESHSTSITLPKNYLYEMCMDGNKYTYYDKGDVERKFIELYEKRESLTM
jgi:hypothetical protein